MTDESAIYEPWEPPVCQRCGCKHFHRTGDREFNYYPPGSQELATKTIRDLECRNCGQARRLVLKRKAVVA